MIVYKCDRCGAYYDKMYDHVRYPSNDTKNGRSFQGLSLIKIDGTGDTYGYTKNFMLCEECLVKIIAFLESPEKDESKEQENANDS